MVTIIQLEIYVTKESLLSLIKN